MFDLIVIVDGVHRVGYFDPPIAAVDERMPARREVRFGRKLDAPIRTPEGTGCPALRALKKSVLPISAGAFFGRR